MGINLHGNILYIKRSSGWVPTYSYHTSGLASSLGVIANGPNTSSLFNTLTSSQYLTPEDYIKIRDTNTSKIICVKNMVSSQELEDDEEFEDIYDSVVDECKNYGKVISIKIPRPEGNNMISGIGKVFVEYATRDGASFAKEHLNGKLFNSRRVEVVFHPEDMYKKNQLD